MKFTAHTTQTTLTLLLVVLVAMTSCKKDNVEPQQFSSEETSNEIREMMHEMQASSMTIQTTQAESNKIGTPECLEKMSFPECAVVERTSYPGDEQGELIVVDFGDGCEDDGELKAGKLTIDMKGDPSSLEFSMITTYENYLEGNKTYNGTVKLTNITQEGDEYNTYQEIKNVTFTTTKNGKDVSSTTSGTIYIEWRSGMDERSCYQNVFAYTGKRNRSMKVGQKSWTVTNEYLEPAVLDEECGYLTEGVLQVTKSHNGKILTYDFGDGDCDHVADLDINGRSYEITLPTPDYQ